MSKTLPNMMENTIAKIREMVDSNEIIGEPIVTADGVTVIPITRLSFGFGSGGSDYGAASGKFSGGGGAYPTVRRYNFGIKLNI